MKLTKQEKKILNLLAHDMTNEEIATLCNITRSTVNNHVRSILSRFNSRTRVGAIVTAHKAEMIDLSKVEPRTKS